MSLLLDLSEMAISSQTKQEREETDKMWTMRDSIEA